MAAVILAVGLGQVTSPQACAAVLARARGHRPARVAAVPLGSR